MLRQGHLHADHDEGRQRHHHRGERVGHIHKAAAGTNGSVVINSGLAAGEITLTAGAGKINKTQPTVEAALAADVIANPANYYMNWHSTLNPGGVIRGQLVKQ